MFNIMQGSYSELAEGNYCAMSMQVAERQILRYAKDIIWVNKDKHTIEEMQKLLKVNCLHKGDFDTTKGKKLLVAVDGSLSSHSALETALKLVEEDDHLFVVTIREKAAVSRRAKDAESDIRLNFELWKASREIARQCHEIIKKTNVLDYTILFPDAFDARRMMVNLCHRFKVDYLIIGKHKKGEKRIRPFRTSMENFLNKRALCQILVF